MKNECDRSLLQLEPDVLAALEVIGPYWQVRANEVLRQIYVENMRLVADGLDSFEIPAFVSRKPSLKPD